MYSQRAKHRLCNMSDSIDISINLLPDELIVKILSYLQPLLKYLETIAILNFRFHRLCLDSSLWKKLVFPRTKCTQESVITKRLLFHLTRWSTVREVDLSYSLDWVRDSHLQYIGRMCHKLTKLKLIGCYRITDLGLKYLGNGCKKVKSLNIHACPEVTCQGVAYVAKHCVNLEELIMSDCEGLWRDPHKMRTISTYCTRLKHFNVGWSSRARGIVVDLDIQHFAMCCRHLKQLNIQSSQITDNGLKFIAQCCRLLEDLDIGHCLITDDGLKYRFTRLKSLSLAGCWHVTDVGLHRLCASSKRLRDVDLSWCFRITDDGLRCLAKACKTLECVSIAHCFSITDDGVRSLLQNCARLERLCLAGVFLLSNQLLQSLFVDSNSGSIKCIDIEECTRITSETVDFLKRKAVYVKWPHSNYAIYGHVTQQDRDEKWKSIHTYN